MTARIIDIRTKRDLTPPPTRIQRVLAAVKNRPNMKYSRDELCVTVLRLTAAFEDLANVEAYSPALRTFGIGALAEIDTLINKLEAK